MYKKAISFLLLGNMIFVLSFLCVRGMEKMALAAKPVSRLKLELAQLEEKAARQEQAAGGQYVVSNGAGLASTYGIGIMDVAVSEQRVVPYELMEHQFAYDLSDEELEVLLRIVEAEAGSEDVEGRLLVANVVLNRMKSERFPSTVKDVVFQQSKGVTQFSPVASGRYYSVAISEDTVTAVGRALMGEDISQGALYFVSRKHADSSKLRWFDTKLTFLFQHGGHEFFK